MAVEKIKILGSVLELQAKTHCQRAKTAPRILIFSITMNADDSINVKFIATYSPIFYVYSISVLAMVRIKLTFFFKVALTGTFCLF